MVPVTLVLVPGVNGFGVFCRSGVVVCFHNAADG